MARKQAISFTVYALEAFTDALTGYSYTAGQEVRGWSYERAQEYQRRGLVRITTSVNTGPGPKETK